MNSVDYEFNVGEYYLIKEKNPQVDRPDDINEVMKITAGSESITNTYIEGITVVNFTGRTLSKAERSWSTTKDDLNTNFIVRQIFEKDFPEYFL